MANGTADCIRRLTAAAGRALTDDEVRAIFERIHKAAQDIKAGRVKPGADLGGKIGKQLGPHAGTMIEQAARAAAEKLVYEAETRARQAHLQLVVMGARMAEWSNLKATGVRALDAIEKMIARDYTGRTNVASLEQKVVGYRDYFNRKLLDTWDALGDDYLGFLQDRAKLVDLIKELRGEDTGNAMAKKGAAAFREVAAEARQTFNEHGGDIGELDDWGFPQHHSQAKVAYAAKTPDPKANQKAWVDAVLPMLDRSRYQDGAGMPWDDTQMREFLEHAWTTIATNGHSNIEPGKYTGTGKRANRHAESRQIHFKDADSVIEYWNQFGEKTALEILQGHVETMARDIAFIEHFGPNPNVTYQTLRDSALKEATTAEPHRTIEIEGQTVKLDTLYNYAAGKVIPTYRQWLKQTADAVSHLNTAGKLGGAALASLFGDKPMMEAVSHMNNLPMLQRWSTELKLLNPANAADRRALQREGLMLDSVRSGLQRFYEGLGQSSVTGRIANAVMRVTGMQAINDIRKGAFGLSLMSAIGTEIQAGKTFAQLADSDVRTLRNYGITEADWNTWRLADVNLSGISAKGLAGNMVALTPEAISRITDNDLRTAGIISQAGGPEEAVAARRDAIVKLLGAVNTESEFAIITPGWRERATFYGNAQRGTVPGEIHRSFLQFKAFPWAMIQRGMDTLANQEGPIPKVAMGAYLMFSTTLAGAMLMQVREMLSGRDPLAMNDENWWKFWGKAFIQGGALGIYGELIYGAGQTRYGSGILETVSGPTLGPLLEIGLVNPMRAAGNAMTGKPTSLAKDTLQDVKGFIPGGNIWYTKAAVDHWFWHNVLDELSPGYISNMRSKALKDYNQDWYWQPGEATPERAPQIQRMWDGR